MRILLLATRDPGGPQTGRKAVIRTIIDSLLALGHEVDLVVLARTAPTIAADPPTGVHVHHVRPPGPARIAWNVVARATTGRRSLNECLYEGSAVGRRITAIAGERRCQVVVADMIRTAELGFATGLPVILDLDDLLSERYRQLSERGRPSASLLGYHQENLPRPLAAAATWAAALALGWESRTLRRREVTCARRAAAVSLVSDAERSRLERAAGRPVACLPMAVDACDEPAGVADNPPTLLFTGKLDYEPNLQALRWYRDHVLPHLGRSGVRLEVIGHCPSDVRAELESPSIHFLGYVDDLFAALGRGRAFVAPIVSGTGVKTKVLEALAAGLPVVATPSGVEGIAVTSAVDCLVGRTGRELAAHIETVLDEPLTAAAIGRAGRDLVRGTYSPGVVRARWEQVLREVVPADVVS